MRGDVCESIEILMYIIRETRSEASGLSVRYPSAGQALEFMV